MVVQSSKPLLDWDAMSRSSKRRELAQLDPATGGKVAVMAAAPITNYQFSRDDLSVTWLDDQTEKTNDDVIFGTDNAARRMTKGSAENDRRRQGPQDHDAAMVRRSTPACLCGRSTTRTKTRIPR
ncbi:MAG: hypothetical protein K2Y23_25605 [Cyanobacteria bacterium]|nr:hypothetical protein [Cyanobacteriota bacterium]